jgi:hypothetical protein
MRYFKPTLYNPNSLFGNELDNRLIPTNNRFGKTAFINFDGLFINPINEKKLKSLDKIGQKNLKKLATLPHGSRKRIRHKKEKSKK